jgi:hypothetical protein
MASRREVLERELAAMSTQDRGRIIDGALDDVRKHKNSRGLGTSSDDLHERLYRIRIVRTTDYSEYGGNVERWEDPTLPYPDCSGGCRHATELRGNYGADWVVCLNPNGPRFGLLTFEHQAGHGCFEPKGRRKS